MICVAYILKAAGVLHFTPPGRFKPDCLSLADKGSTDGGGHSTGRASTSANAAAGVSVELIPEAADWASARTLLPQKSDRLVLLYYRPPVEFIEPFGFVILHFSIVCLIFCTTTATIIRRGVKEK